MHILVKDIKADTRVSWFSKEDFIKLLPEGVEYEILDDVVYTNRKVLVRDRFGLCEVTGRRLKNGTKTSVLNAVDKDSYRISLYRSIHGDNFSYPNFKYRTNLSRINITCNRCGREDVVIDSNHLKKKSGCKTCDTKLGTPRMKDLDFLQRVKDTGSSIEILEERGNYHEPILCKNKYGLVKIQPGALLKGSTGSLRTAVDKTSYMIEQFKERHNGKYSYPNYEYCGNRCVGIMECPIHGSFEQLTDVHLMGSGCRMCSFLGTDRIKGHSRTDFVDVSKGRECILYIVRMFNEEEDFIKIGITSLSVERRIKKPRDIKYNYEIIFEYKSFDAGLVWSKEKDLHNIYKNFYYKPLIPFKGHTECFTTDLPIQEIIDFLKK